MSSATEALLKAAKAVLLSTIPAVEGGERVSGEALSDLMTAIREVEAENRKGPEGPP